MANLYIDDIFQYFSLLIFMFLMEFSVATLAIVYRETVKEKLKEDLQDSIRHHYSNTTDNGLAMIWNHVHNKVRF